jgi:membrane fusion protein (multidrug efflux system)
VEAILDNADRILRPGLTVTLEVIVDRASPVTVMPHAAVVDERAVVRGSEHEVFVVADGTASLKKVEVGRVADEMVEVVSGVTDGDRVVVFGANRLKDGEKAKLHRVDGKLVEGEVSE